MNESDLAQLLAQNPDLRLSRENIAIRGSVAKRKSKQDSAAPEQSEPVESLRGAQGRVFTLELPLPPIQASPNGRFHWEARARATRLYREVCGQFVQAQIGRRRVAGQITVDLDFYLARKLLPDTFYRPRDRDNAIASIKAAIDSLKDANLITNDSKKHLNIGRVDLHTTKKEHQGKVGLVMTIRET